MIPSYRDFMLPYLRELKKGEIIPHAFIRKRLKSQLYLSREEENLLLESKYQLVVDNRIDWARSYLKQEGLISYPSRGMNQITNLGADILSENPSFLSRDYLFKRTLEKSIPDKTETQLKVEQIPPLTRSILLEIETPEQLIENGYSQIKDRLKEELLDTLKQSSPYFFERIVIDLLKKMGYGGHNIHEELGGMTNTSQDGGIDGIMREDPLGLDKIYVQAKRWKNPVGREQIQSFVGALAGRKSKKGIFITTSYFSRGVNEYLKTIDSSIILIDGNEMATLMIEYGLGVITETSYNVKRLDLDYFRAES